MMFLFKSRLKMLSKMVRHFSVGIIVPEIFKVKVLNLGRSKMWENLDGLSK